MKYNDLQKSQGFDLEEYAGKTVERYTFRLNNYPEVKSEVFANVLVFNGKIIGGDICTAALDGFMQGFDANARGECKATFFQNKNALAKAKAKKRKNYSAKPESTRSTRPSTASCSSAPSAIMRIEVPPIIPRKAHREDFWRSLCALPFQPKSKTYTRWPFE